MKKIIALSLITLLTVCLISCGSTARLSGIYECIDADKNTKMTITFNEDGTLIWEESYGYIGGKTFTYYGSYIYNSEDNSFTLNVKGGLLAKDTTFTATFDKKDLIINGGTCIDSVFTKK